MTRLPDTGQAKAPIFVNSSPMTGHASDGSYESPPVVLRKAELRCPPSPTSRGGPSRIQKKTRAKHGSTNGSENRGRWLACRQPGFARFERVVVRLGCHWLSLP